MDQQRVPSSNEGKPACLLVLSASKLGNAFGSFVETFKLLLAEFDVQIATPNAGSPIFFKNCDSQSRAFVNEMTAKVCLNLHNLNHIDPEKYSALVIPHSPGAVLDLAEDPTMARIVLHFFHNQKLICAIGMGVVSLFPAFEKAKVWCFRRFKMTASTVFELTRHPDFDKLNFLPEDVIKERGGIFTCCNEMLEGEGHVEVDRFVITGQNERSTSVAVQTFLAEAKHRLGTSRQH